MVTASSVLDDLDLVLSSWNQTVPTGNPADPSGDNFVGLDDLDIVLGNWNAGTPPTYTASIPEPATFCLLLTIGICKVSLHRARTR